MSQTNCKNLEDDQQHVAHRQHGFHHWTARNKRQLEEPSDYNIELQEDQTDRAESSGQSSFESPLLFTVRRRFRQDSDWKWEAGRKTGTFFVHLSAEKN